MQIKRNSLRLCGNVHFSISDPIKQSKATKHHNIDWTGRRPFTLLYAAASNFAAAPPTSAFSFAFCASGETGGLF